MQKKKDAPASPGKRATTRTIRTTTVTEGPADPAGLEDEPPADPKKQNGIDTRNFANYDSELKSYLAGVAGNTGYVATLYKYDTLHKQKQYICYETANSMLRPHDVGMQIGSGDYRYVVEFENPDLHLPPFYFSVHTVYDEYRAKAGAGPVPDPRAQLQARNALPDAIDMMERLAGVFSKMQPAHTPSNPVADMSAMAEGMSTILQKQFLTQMSLHKQLLDAGLITKQQPQIPAPTNYDAQPEEDGIMEKLAPFMPLIEKIVGVILGGGPAAAMAVEGAKSIPQIAEMLNDKSKLAEAVQELDAKIGAEETDKVLKQFGKKRPASKS